MTSRQKRGKALTAELSYEEDNPAIAFLQSEPFLMVVAAAYGWFQGIHAGTSHMHIEYPDRDNPKFLKNFRLDSASYMTSLNSLHLGALDPRSGRKSGKFASLGAQY